MATGSPNREFTSEELDAMAAAELPVENPETSRTASAAPVASAPTAPEATGSPELAVGDGTSFSIPEPSRGPAMGPVAKLEAGREYSTEELDLIEQANKPKEYTADQLDKSLVSTVFDDPTYIPTRDEYFEAKQLKARLKSEGKIPGLLEDAATGAQGFLQTIGDTIHEISDDPGEFLARSPATMKATAKKSWRNTNDVTRWIRQTNAPTPIGRDEQTGEFVFGQSGAGRSDAEVLAGQQQAAAGQGRSIRAVTEEDLKDEEFDRFVMERSRQKELEEWVASTTAPTEFVTRLVTGRNQTEQPMQATSELAGGLLEPTNIATMGVPLSAGAKTLGLSRLTKAGGARAARVLDRAAAKGIAGMETGAAKFQEIIQKGTKISPENQIKMAKWSAAGGIGGGVFGLDSDIPGVAQAQDAAKFIGGAYLGYKAGLGVLRTVQKIAGPTATILRVASDAGEGFDDIAQASVATKLEAFPELSLVREALENPTRFRPIESTPARLAADPRLGKQTRAIADALASPAIVQGVRGASAVATGAVKGAVANAPFVALALNADEDKAAANMFGMGVGFGAVGGAAGRFTGLEQRRTESRAFDTARMLMDVELAGGDVTKTIQTYSTQQLGDLAAMQGFFRDKVDFVPLDGIERAGDSDFIKNAKVQFQNGAAGLFIQAPPGEKARVFVNLDAKRDGIVPHELGHALLKSGALGSAQADTIRSFTTRRYTQAGVEARGREYATAMIQNENAAKFPGQNFPVTPASISAKMDELGQSGLLRGDMDPLDWARDEIFAEDFRQASQSMDFAGIRRHLPADGSWLGSMENFLGAQANALSISGVRIDPVTGQPDPLFKANPILATDPVLKKQLDQYLNNYRNWINHPDQTKVRGVRVAPAGRASDLANNPQVTFHDYGNGVMANEFARMDPTTGQAAFREQRDITAETIKRQQQVKTLVGSKLIPATDPNLGPKKTADGRVTVRGRILPQKFDFLNGFAQHQRGFARQFETAAATGESMQVRYHSIGSSDSGAFQIKKLGNLEAITREIIPWGWELSGPNNLLASVLDLTQFRNRAIKAINAGEPNIGRLYNNDIKLIEADLKQWMDNHRNDLPGSNKIGEQRRDAINSLIGIGTNINKAANPFSGKIAGPSSAIKQFRLDRVDAAVGTGRLGFHFDYDKANNNLLPEIPTPLPDLSRDLPTGQAMPDAKPLKPIEQMTDRQLSSFLRKHGEQPSSALDVARRWSDGDRMWGAHEMGDELSLSPITDMNDLSGYSRDRLISLPKTTEDALYNPQGQAMPDAVPDKGIEMPAGSMTQLFTTAAKSLPKTIPQAKSVPSVRVMIREKLFDDEGKPVLDKKGNQKEGMTPKLRDNTEVKFQPGDFDLPLPNYQLAKSKFSLGNKNFISEAAKNRAKVVAAIEQVNKATEVITNDPFKFTDPKGYAEIMRDAGVTKNILVPPSGIDMMLKRPKDFIALLDGGFHGPRTVSGTREAAMSGLDSVVEMRKVIGEKPTEFVTALHHLWGTLSKQLPPLDQEALWMRLVVNPEVIEQIQNSINGTFKLKKEQWKTIVNKARTATKGEYGKLGNNATSNANSFYLMLKNHNNRWNQVSDLYATDSAIDMRSKFNSLGHGATGIKNKVQGFIGLTFGIKGTVLDRWRFVDLYMDPVMKATGAPTHQHYFQYTGDAKRIPQDPIGIYANYGTIENDNPAFSLALYNGIDRAAQAAINASPELKAYLGNHADPGGLHWVTWNAIKNEAVGHSSLDLTKNFLKEFEGKGTSSDWVSFVNKSKAHVEGQAANGREIIRLSLDNGVFNYSRQ